MGVQMQTRRFLGSTRFSDVRCSPIAALLDHGVNLSQQFFIRSEDLAEALGIRRQRWPQELFSELTSLETIIPHAHVMPATERNSSVIANTMSPAEKMMHIRGLLNIAELSTA
jgi:hypothetical protein